MFGREKSVLSIAWSSIVQNWCQKPSCFAMSNAAEVKGAADRLQTRLRGLGYAKCCKKDELKCSMDACQETLWWAKGQCPFCYIMVNEITRVQFVVMVAEGC